MANRIYIAIGLLAITFMMAAFIVPHLIDWNAYKGRMEQMAAEALGVEVSIAGDMDFTLLPQPRLHFEDVRIGPESDPIGSAVVAEADFSLMDFLRDRFTVTELRVSEPQLNLVIDAEGLLQTPITLAETASASNVSIGNARFTGGTIALFDMRSGETWQATDFVGSMQMTALRGPFTLQGQADHDGATYSLRLATSPMGADGSLQLSAVLRPANARFSASTEGLLRTGEAPSFEGQFTYRQYGQSTDDAVVGDMLLQSPVRADSDRVQLTEFTLLPDENQATARMTGSASILFGEQSSFDASVSGGVVTLLPAALPEDGPRPYGLMRFLREMPEPLIPPLPGRLEVSVNELGVRGVGLREMRLEALSDGEVWSIENFSGRLPGDTLLALSGTLGRAAGWPAFEGNISLSTQRLDALALLWRRAPEGNPLFRMSASLSGNLQLINDRLRLENGAFGFDGTDHEVGLDIRFGEAPSLGADIALSALNASQSAALMALLPAIEPDGTFGLSFPQGRLALDVERAYLAGLALADLDLEGNWGDGRIAFDRLDIGDFGGLGFAGTALVSGTLAAPDLSGSGTLQLARNARALDLVLPAAGTSPVLRRAVLGSLPAELDVTLDAAGRGGTQTALLEGQAGPSEISLALEMGRQGIFGLGTEQVGVTVTASADDGAALLDQIGAPAIMAGIDGAIANARLFGNPRGMLETELSFEGGGESISFSGDLIVSDPTAIRGDGQVSFLLEGGTAIAELIGAPGLWLPALEGQASLGLVGGESVRLSGISALVGERNATGDLTFSAQRDAALVSGSLGFDAVDVETLAALLAGPAALLEIEPGLWPDGPLDLGAAPRTTRGRVSVTAPALMAGETRVVEALTFDYAWGNDNAGLRGLFGELGGGTVQLDATLCCTSALADKSLTGRVTLNGVDVDAILPEASAQGMGGRLTLGAQLQGSGESYRDLAGSLNGDGSFSLQGLIVESLSPSAFDAAADVDNLVEIEAGDLESLVATALASGPFTANEAGSLISIVGGTARVSNLAVDGNGARLVGGTSLDLETGAIDGRWTLGLTRMLAGNGLITENTGRIGVSLAGTLFAPQSDLDLGPMVDAIQLRAYEIELNELEALRAEQEASQQAAAEEQARLMEEQARRAAEQLLLEQQQSQGVSEETQQLLDDIGALLNGDADAAEPAPTQPANPSFLVLPPGALDFDMLGNPPSQSPVQNGNPNGR